MSLPSHKNLLREFPNPVFIETGTLNGDGLKAAASAGFEVLMSVDINPKVVADVRSMIPRAAIFCGDSPAVLPSMIQHAGTRPITFWLDAHPPTTSPLMAELDAIKAHRNGQDTILIDDVRLFSICFGFTVCDVVAKLKNINSNYTMLLVDGYVPGDILAAIPPMRPSDNVEHYNRSGKRIPLRWR